jgi:hypothetical protein
LERTWIGPTEQSKYRQDYNIWSNDNYSIGYDAALCIHAVEPWVVDVYNSTNGVSTTFRIVGKGDMPSLAHDYGKRVGRKLNLDSSLATTADKWTAYRAALGNSRSILLKVTIRFFDSLYDSIPI